MQKTVFREKNTVKTGDWSNVKLIGNANYKCTGS
jgi:hypothetical protein